ncbi:MAG: type IV pilus assembly protein PilM [Desulfurivibrionaceae bacterium]|nr:type IV pilus assembly protein PilM [Desulfurivibrionaceae bacterium]
MLPFLLKQKLTVGLDIGSHSVKVCEFAEAGKKRKLVSLGTAQLPVGAVEDGELRDPEAVGEVIQVLINNLGIKSKKVAISISGYSVIMKKINLAVMTEEELQHHIQAEAEQYIPFDIDEVYIDFQDLKTNREDDERTDVMLVAAKKEVVNRYMKMLEGIGLQVVVVDVDAFALENSYELSMGQEGNVILVDIGSSKMNINIISGGASVFARDVFLGSRQLTEQIQVKMDVSFEEAEDLKISAQDPGGALSLLEETFAAACTQWILEIKKAIDFYNSNYPEHPLDKMVLSGGGAHIRGLDHYFANELFLDVELFNPFAAAEVDAKKIDPEYLTYIAPEMAISSGLASRKVPF